MAFPMRKMVVSNNRLWFCSRTLDQAAHARVVVNELQGKSLRELDQYCTKILEKFMGDTPVSQVGFCKECRAENHKACKTNECRCRRTQVHYAAISETEEELPEEFAWEEPPPQQGRHPLTPEKKIALKTRPGKYAHIKHYKGKSSAYQVVKNFNAGKYKDLDIGEWDMRHVKDGVRGEGSDVYAAYIGEL